VKINNHEAPFTISPEQSALSVYIVSLAKCWIWSTPLYGAETWSLLKVGRKYLESFEMWCWRRMEKINWTDRVRN